MMIRVVFFASVREALGEASLELESTEIETVSDVIRALSARGPEYERVLGAENLLVAVNQAMVDAAHEVASGDEVAFFPPVTGG